MKNEDGKKQKRRVLMYGPHGVGKSYWRPDFPVEFLTLNDGDEASGQSKRTEPHGYQIEATKAAWDQLGESPEEPLHVLPTGAGKSLVIESLIRDSGPHERTGR